MSSQCFCQCATVHIPQPDQLVFATASQCVSVGTQVDKPDCVFVTGKCLEQCAVGRAPESNSRIVATGRQIFAVMTECKRGHTSWVFQLVNDFSVSVLPDLGSAINARARDRVAFGTEHYRPHTIAVPGKLEMQKGIACDGARGCSQEMEVETKRAHEE